MKPPLARWTIVALALAGCAGPQLPTEVANPESGIHSPAFSLDLGYGPDLFYYLRHDPDEFSTFGTISTSGAVIERFGVGGSFEALAFAGPDLGYGPDLFYYLRHDLGGFSTFGTISTSGDIDDRFGVGSNFVALAYAAPDLGYGPDLFYYLRQDAGGFSTFGTVSTSGAVVDRFGVGTGFDALTFVAQDLGYGPNLFYYLRRDAGGFSTFGTISTSGAVVDRFGVGLLFESLAFASADLGYGPNLFYYLRDDASGFSTFGTISTSGLVIDRFGVGSDFDALVFPAEPAEDDGGGDGEPTTVAIDVKPDDFPNAVNPRSRGRLAVALLSSAGFDPANADLATVRFGPTGTEAAPVQASPQHLNDDGVPDLILQFRTPDTGIACGDTVVRLTGTTVGGEAFAGEDAIVTVGCGG